MATKALLDRDPYPDTQLIKETLQRNLCRCTGYKKIIEAVKLAADLLSGKTTSKRFVRIQRRPDRRVPSTAERSCASLRSGEILRRHQMEGVLELAAIRSPSPHALIKSIDYSAAKLCLGWWE